MDILKNPYAIKLAGNPLEQFLLAIQKAEIRDLSLYFENETEFISKLPKEYFEEWKQYEGIEDYFKSFLNENDFKKLKRRVLKNRLKSQMFILQVWDLVDKGEVDE